MVGLPGKAVLCLLMAGMSGLALASPVSNGVVATQPIIVGRYLTVANIATQGQADLLQQTFQLRFPASVRTISDALHYLLRFSGYSLVSFEQLPLPAQNLLQQPLPAVDRNLGPLTLEQGVLTLVGQPFGLVVDPAHRLLFLRIKSIYQPIFNPVVISTVVK